MATTLERPDASPRPPESEPGPPARGRRGPAGWSARWRVALLIAARTARRNRLSTTIATAMIALPVAAAVFLISFLQSSGGTPMGRFEAQYGTSAQAYLADQDCSGCLVEQDAAATSWGWTSEPGGEPATTRSVQAILPGAQVVESMQGSEPLSAGDLNIGMHEIEALPVEHLAEVYSTRTGRLPANAGEVALHWREAERLGVSEGDLVGVGDHELVVTGVIDSRNRPSRAVVTVPGELDLSVAGWYVFGEEPVTWADVLELNATGVVVASRAVIADPPPEAVDPWVVEGGTERAGAIGLGAAIAAIAVIEAVLLVGPAFAVGTRRQTRQLALVAASGGSTRDLRRIVLASGVVIGVIAGLVGTLVGIAGLGVLWLVLRSGWDPLAAFTISAPAILGSVGGAVGLGLLASLVPARTVSRLEVVAVLGGRRAEAAPPRRSPWIGYVLVALGLGAGVAGALDGAIGLVVGGIVVLEIGMVLATGGLLASLVRLAPRLGVAGRFAVRDALRQRSRTVPAVASVIAAVAAVVAGAVYAATDDGITAAGWRPGTGVGTIVVSADWQVTPDRFAAALPDAIAAVEEEVALEGWAPVWGLRTADDGEELGSTGLPPDWQAVALWPLVNPDRACPADETTTPEEWAELDDDPRCLGRSWSTTWSTSSSEGTIVDDGTVVSLFTADGSAQAAAALAAGEIVVASADDVWDDGTAHIELTFYDPAGGTDETRSLVLVAPAHLGDFGTGVAILPSSLVAETDGLEQVLIGAVARPAVDFDEAWADRVRGERGAASVSVVTPYSSGLDAVMAAFVGVAALVALAATWLSVALAGAETRPDLATLSAVGADPRVTRRVAGAQAAVVAVVGVWVGVVLGLALGWILSTWTLRASWTVDALLREGLAVPGVVVPWPWIAVIALALPALAVAGAWLTAPRRFPMVRRLGQ